MVDTQVRPSDVTKFPIIDAMLAVPREQFVPQAQREAAYVGENLDIGGGRVLLEARTFAKMLDGLNVAPGDVVLDIACGYGYSTAVLARMAEFVVGLEDDAGRAAEAQATLSSTGVDNAAVMDGVLSEGAPKNGPYDVVVLHGAVETVPQAIVDQMNDGGRIGCLVGAGQMCEGRVGVKADGRIGWRQTFNAAAPYLAGFEQESAFAL